MNLSLPSVFSPRRLRLFWLLAGFWLILTPAFSQKAERESSKSKTAPAAVSSLKPEDLQGSASWTPPLRERLQYALTLTEKNLTYKFGSEDPSEGGMDCSGTIYHVLRRAGLKSVPRQSDELYRWVEKAGNLTKVTGTPELGDPVFGGLKPGDLLFWSGTYDTGSRELPVSHTMMYLGLTKAGKPVMFGASDGRVYQGEKRNGVSVFDFKMPRKEGKARFAGYGPPPGADAALPPQKTEIKKKQPGKSRNAKQPENKRKNTPQKKKPASKKPRKG